jgi:hypothetical protein
VLLADSSVRSDQVLERKSPREVIVVKPLLRVPQYSLQVEPKDEGVKDQTKDQGLEYSPAIQPEFGLSVSWKDVTLTGTIPMPRDSEEDEKTGVTKYRDFKFDYRRGVFGFDVGYQEYQGFYREQSETSSDSEKSYEKRPDLRKRSQYLNLFYFPFGERLSKADLISPAEHEGAPFGWSPVLQVALDRTAIGGEKPLVTSEQLALVANDSNFRAGSFDSYGGAVGLAGSWTKPTYNIYGALTVGSMFQRQSYEVLDETKYRQGQAERVAFRSAFTYYYADFSTGLTIMYDQTEIPLKDLVVTSSVGDATIFLGKAF